MRSQNRTRRAVLHQLRCQAAGAAGAAQAGREAGGKNGKAAGTAATGATEAVLVAGAAAPTGTLAVFRR